MIPQALGPPSSRWPSLIFQSSITEDFQLAKSQRLSLPLIFMRAWAKSQKAASDL